MTRLIDADAIDKRYVPIAPLVDWATVHYEWVAFIDDINELPTVDAVPIEFIQKRIEALKEIADYTFTANGGYVEGSDYEMWALEELIDEWRKENE